MTVESGESLLYRLASRDWGANGGEPAPSLGNRLGDILALAERHRVLIPVVEALDARGCRPGDLPTPWTETVDRYIASATAMRQELTRLESTGLFGSGGVRVLKGSTVAAMYPRTLSRQSKDIDLYSLEIGQHWLVCETLVDLGYQCVGMALRTADGADSAVSVFSRVTEEDVRIGIDLVSGALPLTWCSSASMTARDVDDELTFSAFVLVSELLDRRVIYVRDAIDAVTLFSRMSDGQYAALAHLVKEYALEWMLDMLLRAVQTYSGEPIRLADGRAIPAGDGYSEPTAVVREGRRLIRHLLPFARRETRSKRASIRRAKMDLSASLSMRMAMSRRFEGVRRLAAARVSVAHWLEAGRMVDLVPIDPRPWPVSSWLELPSGRVFFVCGLGAFVAAPFGILDSAHADEVVLQVGAFMAGASH